MAMVGRTNQMESAGFGESLEERRFFRRASTKEKPAPRRARRSMEQMDSLGFGDSLPERIFFIGVVSTRDPSKAARLEARKAAAGLLEQFAALGHEDVAHCERVAAWSRRLARELSLPSERVLDIELGALLHDVGYVRLRAIDFQRRGRLNAGELFELHRHPAIGARLLKDVPALHRAIPLTASHHERYDGTGYPEGLRGDDIPIDGRIFHLVDAYDAMTRERPHRGQMTDAAARGEIERSVGSQFDPVVHLAFHCIEPAEWLDLVRDFR